MGFILLDADKEALEKRLRSRYQTKDSVEIIERVSGKSVQQFIQDNIDFSGTIRDEAEQFGINIVDTTSLSPEEVAKEVVKLIKNRS